uniref:ANK_REP_REGION domain-containing protein n=1 Tax=Anopheles melas TaxID=34690 RepID=A0A182TIL5_9DIPT
MDELERVKHHSDICLAVEAGDIARLHELINAGILRKGDITHPRCLLLLAISSRNLEVVKLVMEYFEPDPNAANEDGGTPLLYACQVECPAEIIIYLMEHSTKDDSLSPLEYVLFQNRVELAKSLIAYEATRPEQPAKHFTPALYIVAVKTGNLELLQHMLEALHNAGHSFVTEQFQGLTGMELFAQNAAYALETKVECFKMLFNVLHPNTHTADPVRYNVNDIVNVAILSTQATSLIPYFIEMEKKWETRPSIMSLYERLLAVGYDILAFAVLCEHGPVTIEREQLDTMLEKLHRFQWESWVAPLRQMFVNAFEPSEADDAPSPLEAMQLLQDFAAFTETITLKFSSYRLHEAVSGVFQEISINRHQLYQATFHRAIECIMIMEGCSADDLVGLILCIDSWYDRALQAFPFLKYCNFVLMRPDWVDVEENNRLMNWFVHLFGPWKAIRQYVGKPVLEVFTLKRLARDVVRDAVWRGVEKNEPSQCSFLERLSSLDVPKELSDYLRYCDYSSIRYFLEHFDAVEKFMKVDANKTLPYPVVL